MLAANLLYRKKSGNGILQLEYEGTPGSQNFIDSSGGRTPKTIFPKTTIDNSLPAKYGSTSGLFYGSQGAAGLYYDYARYPDLMPGLQDYTFETYCYLPTISNDNGRFLNMGVSAGSSLYANFHVYGGANLWFGIGNSQSGPNLFNIAQTDGSVPAAAWFHMACCRAGNTYRLFLNGIQKAIGTETTKTNLTFDTTGVVAIGCMYQGNYSANFGSINGHFDRTILTVGLAKYTSNFTPS